MMNIAIVVPCYNEQDVLKETTSQMSSIISQLNTDKNVSAVVYFVDDGSKDATWKLIENLKVGFEFVRGIKLAHNVGHQNALWAGLEFVKDKCDAAITIDADLQDDINAILYMVESFKNGKEVVYGVRKERKTDTFFKRNTALMFYRLMQTMGVDVVYNHADYRLMSKRVLEALMQYPERNIFLRGIVPMIGFPSENVYYDRAERFAGESKYPFGKMLNFAIEGITSFSVKPLRLITFLGGTMLFVSMLAAIYAIVSYCIGITIQGWTSILLSVWLVCGVQMISIGVIGEYIGKIYTEVKRRPRFFVEKDI